MRHVGRVVASVASVLLLAGCSGDDPQVQPIEPDGNASAEAPAPDPEPGGEVDEGVGEEPDDPFAVPDEIDVGYAQRVFDELFRIQAEVYNDVLETGVPDDGLIPLEQMEPLRSIAADGEIYAVLVDILENAAAEDFERLQQPIQPRAFTVADVALTDGGCIFAEGEVDFSATAVDPRVEELAHEYILEPSEDNRTGWAILNFSAITDDFGGFDPDEEC